MRSLTRLSRRQGVRALTFRDRISIRFIWYDFWVGFYYDRMKRVLYFCPIPMLAIKIKIGEPFTILPRDF